MAVPSPLGRRQTVAALSAAGAGILQWSPTAVIALAAVLVAVVAGALGPRIRR
jgi:hypothetical protein